MQVRHLQEFVDQEKRKAEKIKIKHNLRFDQERKEVDDPMKDDLPAGTIHMIGGPHDLDLEIGYGGRSE